MRERNAKALGHYVVNLVRVSDSGFKVVRSLIFMNAGSWQSYDGDEYKGRKRYGKTDYIITAHDHVNNFNIRYQGVNLIYAMKTGKSCYADPEMMGATVVTIASDGSASFENILDL